MTYADMDAPRAICTPSPLNMLGAEQDQLRVHKCSVSVGCACRSGTGG